jgi:hypothetical protein
MSQTQKEDNNKSKESDYHQDDKQLEGEQAKETHKRAINQIFDIKYIFYYISCV